jgi:membrane dipeptidase
MSDAGAGRPARTDLLAGVQARNRLGISREAIDLYVSSDVIDLHVESFIWTRLARYDLWRRHGRGLFGARFYSQVDLPRLLEAGLAGAVFSIATWPLRRRGRRTRTFLANLARLRAILDARPERLHVVRDHAGYVAARSEGKVAIWIGVQGGNALDSDPDDLERIPGDVVSRITLVHLTRSSLGGSSAFGDRLSSLSGGRELGLTSRGREYVAEMNRRRILVDLAHISRRGFREVLEAHDRSLPVIVSHAGVRGIHDHWRNLDDEQIKGIAATGGVIGVIFHSSFLGEPILGGRADSIVAHMEHIIHVAGEESAALGSDWDGMICTPRDMPTVLELPVLVERMLARGWKADRIRKVLGGNYLRVMKAIRPGT